MADPQDGGLGIAIAGAGARGAYEIGVLSVLLPWLRAHGETPRVVVGTSAGAINAVLVAALASAPDPEAAAELAVASWRSIGRADVFRSIAVSSPGLFTRYAATVLGLARPPFDSSLAVTALLDPGPLLGTLRDLGPWRHLHAAVGAGVVRSVAVVTTSAGGAATSVFVESADDVPLPPDDAGSGLTYRRARLAPEHVMASAAIPLAFPPVRLPDDGPLGDWHFDGGVRLNAPVKPALDLGADHLLVVATHPLPDVGAPASGAARPPDVVDVATSVLRSVLVDRMAQDVRNLDRVNRLVEAGGTGIGYRCVPYLFVAPQRPDALGILAEQVLRDKYGGIPFPGSYDYTVLTRLLGGPGASHGELMSFLLFDPDYIELLVEAGQRDAAAAVHAALPGELFRTSSRPTVTAGPPAPAPPRRVGSSPTAVRRRRPGPPPP
jgi:NTE family protein